MATNNNSNKHNNNSNKHNSEHNNKTRSNNNNNNNNSTGNSRENFKSFEDARPSKCARRRLISEEEMEGEKMDLTLLPDIDTELNMGNTNNNSQEISTNFRTFQDSIHGTILMDSVLVAIIDTPQFQRLRDIKQLGLAYWVFPSATHSRFEHCIGTSYLCGRMLTSLRELHRNIYKDDLDQHITDTDILCVKIAGLCHDLGHGPFSHLFDSKIIKQLQPDTEWEHEKGSCDLFDYILETNPRINEILERHGIREIECDIIKTMIRGTSTEVKKQFLYEILANKSTGIDCDKFDYIARDTYYIGMKNCFDFQRYFNNIRILQINNQLRIGARDKEEFNLYELFHTRLTLHKQVYQHKTIKILDEMIAKALIIVDGHLGISSSIYDMEKYTNMTDSIIWEILRSKDTSKEIQEAKTILKRIQQRQLYQSCGQINPGFIDETNNSNDNDKSITSSQLKIQAERMKEEVASYRDDINPDDIYVCRSYFSFGKKDKNPLECQPFFAKDGELTKCQLSGLTNLLLPRSFEEEYFRVYCTNTEKKSRVEDAFSKWCKDNGYRCSPEKLRLDK